MSTPERHRRLMALFEEVCDLTGTARADRLAAVTQEDAGLARELGALLAADASGGNTRQMLDDPFQTVDPPPRLPDTIGSYRVLAQLGAGGMGVVYEAEQDLPRRRVAVKVIRGSVDTPRMRRRFELESHVLARLGHPGIARVYEAVAGPDGCWIAMELVEGQQLDRHVTALGRYDRIELMARIAEAVHHAHVKGVIHCDLKPANILVGADGQPKILDFGIARLVEPEGELTGGTLTGQLAGTPAYMSPEQAALKPELLDARSDIYTLGVISFAVLTGRLPYEVRDVALPEILRRVREDDPPPASRFRPDLAGDVETILAKAMAREPDARYQSAQAFADDLRRHLKHLPIAARPPTVGYQLRKFARRNRALVAALAGTLAALVAGAVTATALYLRAERARAALALRNDALTVVAAENALGRDPTQAVASLKGLSPGASWDDARAVASGAAAAGVAREVLTGHTGEVHVIDSSPDGTRLATASYDGTVRLWDLARRRVRVVPVGSEVRWVGLAPDGQAFAAGSRSGALVFGTFDGPARAIQSSDFEWGAWSPDGKTLATVGDDGTLRLWSRDGASTGVLAGEGALHFVAWNRDGKRLVTAGADGAIRVWRDGAGAVIGKHGGEATMAAWLPDGETVLGVGRDGSAVLWPGGVQLEVGGDELKLCAAADDGTLAWAGRDGRVRVRRDGQERVVGAHDGVVRAIALAPGGRLLASAGDDRTVRLWDLATGGSATLAGHQAWVRDVRFTRDGRGVLSVSDDGTARVWPVVAPAEPTARRVAIAPDGTLALARADGSIQLGARALGGHADEVYELGFSADGKTLFSSGRDRTVRLWDVASGAARVLKVGARATRAALSPSGEVAVATPTDAVLRFDAGGALHELAGHGGRVTDVAFSPDGGVLASASEDGTVRLWGDGRVLGRARGAVLDLAFAPDGKRLAAGAEDGVVRIFDLAGGATVEVTGHDGPVTAVAFAPDGRSLASGGADRTVRLWDGAASRLLGSHGGAIRRLVFAAGGELVAGAADGTVRAWPGGRLLVRGRGAVQDLAVGRGTVAAANDDDGLHLVPFGAPAGEAEVRALLDGLTAARVDADGALTGDFTRSDN